MSNKFALGRTKEERQEILADIISYFESGMSLDSIAKSYGVSRQAISLNLIKSGYSPRSTNITIKQSKIKSNIMKQQDEEISKLKKRLRAMKTYNCTLRKQIQDLTKGGSL